MEIYERIFERLKELHMTQLELSRRTGIATSTICDWKKKKINPQSDKLVSICKALEMSLVDLLCNEDDKQNHVLKDDYTDGDKTLIEIFTGASPDIKRSMLRYFELLISMENAKVFTTPQRNVSVIQDADGKNIVVINDIIFKGKRSVNWKAVRAYLKQYIGEIYEIASTEDIIYIGLDLPNEYSGSKYTNSLKGTNAKAKANAAQGIPEMVEIAVGKHYRTNQEDKHKRDAKNGWYRYDSYFALPVYSNSGEIERYNVFHASMLIRYANDGKMYLYDIIDIKKETSNSLGE